MLNLSYILSEFFYFNKNYIKQNLAISGLAVAGYNKDI